MECSICMEAVQGETNLAKTECGHTFHFQCLYRWNRKHTNCPLCRKEFGKFEEEYGGYGREIGQYVQQIITMTASRPPFLLTSNRLNLEQLASRHYAEVPLEEFTGEIEERDIQLVMEQGDVSHEIAERYLRYYHGDIVDTLMCLTENPALPIPPFRRRLRQQPPPPYEKRTIKDRLITSRRKEAKSGYESA